MLFFRTKDHLEHLNQINVACGPFPQWMLRETHKRKTPYARRSSRDESMFRLQLFEPVKQDLLNEVIPSVHRPLRDFIRYLMVVDPHKRPTPDEALRHPFFVTVLDER